MTGDNFEIELEITLLKANPKRLKENDFLTIAG